MALTTRHIKLKKIDTENVVLKFSVEDTKAVHEFLSRRELQEFLKDKFCLSNVSGRDIKIVHDADTNELTISQNLAHIKHKYYGSDVDHAKYLKDKDLKWAYQNLVMTLISYIMSVNAETKDILVEIAAHIQDREYSANHYRSGVCQGAKKLAEHIVLSQRTTRTNDYKRGCQFIVAFNAEVVSQLINPKEDAKQESSKRNDPDDFEAQNDMPLPCRALLS